MTQFNEAVTKFSFKSFASVRNIWVGDTSEEQFLTSVPKPLAVTRCFRCYSQPISESCYYWLQPTYSGETKPKRKEKKKRKGGISWDVHWSETCPTASNCEKKIHHYEIGDPNLDPHAVFGGRLVCKQFSELTESWAAHTAACSAPEGGDSGPHTRLEFTLTVLFVRVWQNAAETCVYQLNGKHQSVKIRCKNRWVV